MKKGEFQFCNRSSRGPQSIKGLESEESATHILRLSIAFVLRLTGGHGLFGECEFTRLPQVRTWPFRFKVNIWV